MNAVSGVGCWHCQYERDMQSYVPPVANLDLTPWLEHERARIGKPIESASKIRGAIEGLPVGKDIRTRLSALVDTHIQDLEKSA